VRNVVRERRTEQGISQAALAEAVAVSRQTINAIETGRYLPSLPLAFALAAFFGTPIEGLFSPEEDELPCCATPRPGGPTSPGT
jgi:putative transcriptional regulator